MSDNYMHIHFKVKQKRKKNQQNKKIKIFQKMNLMFVTKQNKKLLN